MRPMTKLAQGYIADKILLKRTGNHRIIDPVYINKY